VTSDNALNIDGENIFRGHAAEISEELKNQ
jgi:hypothetical protein